MSKFNSETAKAARAKQLKTLLCNRETCDGVEFVHTEHEAKPPYRALKIPVRNEDVFKVGGEITEIFAKNAKKIAEEYFEKGYNIGKEEMEECDWVHHNDYSQLYPQLIEIREERSKSFREEMEKQGHEYLGKRLVGRHGAKVLKEVYRNKNKEEAIKWYLCVIVVGILLGLLISKI